MKPLTEEKKDQIKYVNERQSESETHLDSTKKNVATTLEAEVNSDSNLP